MIEINPHIVEKGSKVRDKPTAQMDQVSRRYEN